MRRLLSVVLVACLLGMPTVAHAQTYGPSRFYTLVGEDPGRSSHTWQVEVRQRLDFGSLPDGGLFWEILVRPESQFLNGEQGHIWQKDFDPNVLDHEASQGYCARIVNSVCAETFSHLTVAPVFRPRGAYVRLSYVLPGSESSEYAYDGLGPDQYVALTTVTPEPGTLALLGGGLGLLGVVGWRRRRA